LRILCKRGDFYEVLIGTIKGLKRTFLGVLGGLREIPLKRPKKA